MTTTIADHRNGRRRSDQEADYDAFYGNHPHHFGPEFRIGIRVSPAFASPVEGMGEGEVIEINADRDLAAVKFDRSGAVTNCAPEDLLVVAVQR